MDTNNIGNLLMEKGTKFYQWGKSGFGSFICGSVLAGLICLISFLTYEEVYFFDGYAFTGVLWICAFFLIAVGSAQIPLYFIGLHYMGLGRLNQYNEAIYQHLSNHSGNMTDELPDL